MAAANSTPSLKCEVCTATVTLYSKFCATCGAKVDEETQALKYYFNEGYEYEVILCFLLIVASKLIKTKQNKVKFIL